MTKSHNPHSRDDETRYVRYAPCLCFRFLQTCQYVSYVLLLACIIYIFFSVTSWHPLTSSTSVTSVKYHPHYRPKPNGFRPSGFGLRMKQGYPLSKFHNKRKMPGKGFNKKMRKKMKSNVSQFTINDVPVFPGNNLVMQDSTSDHTSNVFPLESGGQYKYTGADLNSLDIIPPMSTKSPKRLPGTPSQGRHVQTGKKTKAANRSKPLTNEEHSRLSTKDPSGRGLHGGPKRTQGHVRFEETETKQPRVVSKSKSENVQLDTGKPSSKQHDVAMKMPIVAKDDVVPKKGAKGKNPITVGKVQMKKMHVDKLTSKRLKGKSDKMVFSNQPRVLVKQHMGGKHKQIHPFPPPQKNLRKIDLLHDTKVIPKTREREQGSLTSTKRNLNGGSVSSVQTRPEKLKLQGQPERLPETPSVDGIKSQGNVSRGKSESKSVIGLPKGTQQLGKQRRTHIVDKLNIVKKGSSDRMENSTKLRNQMKLYVAKNKEFNGSSEIDAHKRKPTVPKSENTRNDRTKTDQKRPAYPKHDVRGKNHVEGQFGARSHVDLRGHESSRDHAGQRGHNEVNGSSEINVHKRKPSVTKSENTTNDRSKPDQKRPVYPKHDVRGQGHNVKRGHGKVRPHNNQLRRENDHQDVRGQGHSVVPDQGDVRPHNDVSHSDVRGQGHDVVQSHTGVRGRDKVRSQEGLRSHGNPRGHEGARGNNHVEGQFGARSNVDLQGHESSRGHVDLRGQEGSQGHAGQRGHNDAKSQRRIGTKIDQKQQAKPTGTKYIGNKTESNASRSRNSNAKTIVQITRSARPSQKALNPPNHNMY